MKEAAYLEWESHIVWDKKNHDRNAYKEIFSNYVNYFFNRIQDKKTFSHFRFCDGEYRCMFHHKTVRNAMTDDEISFYNKKLYELIEFKKNNIDFDDLIIHMQSGSPYCKEFEKYICMLDPQKLTKINDPVAPSLDGVCGSGVFGFISVADNFMEKFLELVNESEYYIILVGPEYLEKFNDLRVDSHVKSVLLGSWKYQEQLENDIRFQIEYSLNELNKTPLILYAASIGGKISLLNLYYEYRNLITQLDCGSIFDGMINIISRPWHKQLIEYYKSIGKIPNEELTTRYNIVGENETKINTTIPVKNRLLNQRIPHEVITAPPPSFPAVNNLNIIPQHLGFNSNYTDLHDLVFSFVLNGNESNILEIGNWAGIITKKINQYSSTANIITVSDFFGDGSSVNHGQIKINEIRVDSILKSIQNSFAFNVEHIKDKVTVHGTSPLTGLDSIITNNKSIDFIYIHNLFYTYDVYLKCLNMVIENYPTAKIVGNGYMDNTDFFFVQRTLKQLQYKLNRKIKNKQDVWYIA